MQKISILITLVVSIIILALPVLTVKADPQFEAVLRIQDQNYTVGDPINIELAVTHPAGYQVIFPKYEQTWGQFTINSVNPPTKIENSDGTKTSTQVIDARLFAPGIFVTPELNLSISDENGNLNEITAAPISVTINSVLIEGDTQLRDIKPQAEIAFFNIWTWLFSLFIFVLFICGIAYLRNRHKHKRLVEMADNRTADEIALGELNHIESLKLPENGKFKEHYTLTSICIRRYLETTLGIIFLERATFEIQRSLKQNRINNELINQIVGFLEESDLVKFSKFTPDETSAYMLLESGREIIKITKPDPENTTGGEEANQSNPSSHNFNPSKNNITEKLEVIA